jgi:hypothetical protein
MKKIVEYKDVTKCYAIGDVVYLNSEEGKPTCRAEAVKNDNGTWLFKPLSKQSYYAMMDGLIPFRGKPCIYAKEVEVKEEQP